MPKHAYKFKVVSKTSVKRNINQDSYMVKSYDGDKYSFCFAAIADGMGGLASGNIASNRTMDILEDWWEDCYPRIKSSMRPRIQSISAELDNEFNKINSQIIQLSIDNNEQMGTTLSILLIIDGQAIIKNVGDSRIYAFNQNIKQLTIDDTWVNMQIVQGKLLAQDAINHPESHVLTQCIGVNNKLEVHTCIYKMHDDEQMLLCSDGFYKRLELVKLQESIMQAKGNVETILNDAITEVRNNGEKDDVTAIVVNYSRAGFFCVD